MRLILAMQKHFTKRIPNVRNFFAYKGYPMLTDLNGLSLACKCIFYRPEHNAKGATQN